MFVGVCVAGYLCYSKWTTPGHIKVKKPKQHLNIQPVYVIHNILAETHLDKIKGELFLWNITQSPSSQTGPFMSPLQMLCSTQHLNVPLVYFYSIIILPLVWIKHHAADTLNAFPSHPLSRPLQCCFILKMKQQNGKWAVSKTFALICLFSSFDFFKKSVIKVLSWHSES